MDSELVPVMVSPPSFTRFCLVLAGDLSFSPTRLTPQAVQNRSMGGFSRLHAGHFMERIPYTIPHQPASGGV